MIESIWRREILEEKAVQECAAESAKDTEHKIETPHERDYKKRDTKRQR